MLVLPSFFFFSASPWLAALTPSLSYQALRSFIHGPISVSPQFLLAWNAHDFGHLSIACVVLEDPSSPRQFLTPTLAIPADNELSYIETPNLIGVDCSRKGSIFFLPLKTSIAYCFEGYVFSTQPSSSVFTFS